MKNYMSASSLFGRVGKRGYGVRKATFVLAGIAVMFLILGCSPTTQTIPLVAKEFRQEQNINRGD